MVNRKLWYLLIVLYFVFMTIYMLLEFYGGTADKDTSPEQKDSISVLILDSAKQILAGHLYTLRTDSAFVDSLVDMVIAESTVDISAELIAAILTHETSNLNELAIGSAGEIGLMQIMPLHIPIEECGVYTEEDLFVAHKNICVGARIMQESLERCDFELRCALLRYNGCIVLPDTFKKCYEYPDKVKVQMLFLISKSF